MALAQYGEENSTATCKTCNKEVSTEHGSALIRAHIRKHENAECQLMCYNKLMLRYTKAVLHVDCVCLYENFPLRPVYHGTFMP
jgi:hypothetical protein